MKCKPTIRMLWREFVCARLCMNCIRACKCMYRLNSLSHVCGVHGSAVMCLAKRTTAQFILFDSHSPANTEWNGYDKYTV